MANGELRMANGQDRTSFVASSLRRFVAPRLRSLVSLRCSPFAIRNSRVLVILGIMLMVANAGCHKSAPTPPPAEPQAAADAPKPPLAEAAPPQIPLPDDPDAADRWLFVEKTKNDAPGGWATGSFDRQKNKLDIRTRDVRRFAIDVERIAIDWQRLVVISIDGKNSELRRREVTLLHFQLDDHGQWVVTEP